MKIYYIYSDYYDQDWIDHIEHLQSITVFRNKNAIRQSLEDSTAKDKWNSFNIVEQGRSCDLIDQNKHFNMVFAVQALE